MKNTKNIYVYIYVNMCICYRVIGKMHLDEFGVNTIGNQSKLVCPKISGCFLKVIQRVVSTTCQCSGGSHEKSTNKKCGYPGCGIKQLASFSGKKQSRLCDLETSITTFRKYPE